MPGYPASLICGITENSSSAPSYVLGVGPPQFTEVNVVPWGLQSDPSRSLAFMFTEDLILTSLGHGNQNPPIMIRMRH